mmetsp:Transcript_4761/g.5545  ORF Transcript_4761/g.5545 Transcript_4761/m.5545 type:complete len:189 (+) Transcript_4761:243-809(+)
MNHWAQAYGPQCTFLCICVTGEKQAWRLAVEMGKQMKLAHCVNGYIDNRKSLPSYGQLGCQGFIVFNKDGAVVNARTSPYLEVRERAFMQVQSILDGLLLIDGDPDSAAVSIGDEVHITALTSANGRVYNGQIGVCISALQAGRVAVQLKSGKQLSLPSANVLKVTSSTNAGGDPLNVPKVAVCDTGS